MDTTANLDTPATTSAAAVNAASSAQCRRQLIGLPAFLIFLVFGLSGISIALFSFSFQSIVDKYLGEEQALPEVTIFLMKFPIFGWIAVFLMVGFLVSFWFEKLERHHGEVPRRAASLVAIVAMLAALLILTGLSLPFFDGMGASGR